MIYLFALGNSGDSGNFLAVEKAIQFNFDQVSGLQGEDNHHANDLPTSHYGSGS
jgi:hypothetical protein